MDKLTHQKIKNLLENDPLYIEREFTIPENLSISNLLIREIEEYCEYCDKERLFHDIRPKGSGAGRNIETMRSGETVYKFTCVSCRKEHLKYYVNQTVCGKNISIQKVGEFPRKKIARDKILTNFFVDDAENYEKALVLL